MNFTLVSPFHCQGKEIHLKHRAPVLSICVIDRNAAPLPSTLEVNNERAKAADMTGSHQVVIVSEEQFKVIFNIKVISLNSNWLKKALISSVLSNIGFFSHHLMIDEMCVFVHRRYLRCRALNHRINSN